MPLLTTALFASLTLPASPAHAADCAGANLLPALASIPTAKAATLCLLNDERASRGLASLTPQPELEAAADAYARSMVQQRFFGHVAPGGQTISDRLAGYVASAGDWATGENLAWGENALATPSAIVRGWMRSAGHRDNILSAEFTEIGVGIAAGTPTGALPGLSATYTTEFGMRRIASSSPSASPLRASASSLDPVPATAKTRRLSAKQKRQISKRCHAVARRTKASKKTRKARYDRCVRSKTRAATR